MSRSRLLAIALSLLMVLSVVTATAGAAGGGGSGSGGPAAGAAPIGGTTAAPTPVTTQATSGGSVSRVAFDYAALGGNINIEVNGDLVYNVTQLDAAPPDGIDGATIGGASVSVTSSGSSGHVEITGEIRSFSLGGQEFPIDNVEFGPRSNPNATVTFRSLTPFQSSYAVGDQFSSDGVDITVEGFTFSDGSTYRQGSGRQVNDTDAGGPRPEFFTGNVRLRFNVSSLPPTDGGEGGGDENVITGFHRPQLDGQLFGHTGQVTPEGKAPEWADGFNTTTTFAATEGGDVRAQVFTKAIGDTLYVGSTAIGQSNPFTDAERIRLRLDRDGNGELSGGDVRLTATGGAGPVISFVKDHPQYATLTGEVYRNGEWTSIDAERRRGYGVLAIRTTADNRTTIEARIDRGELNQDLGGGSTAGLAQTGIGSAGGNVGLDVQIQTESNSYTLGGDGPGYAITGTDVGRQWVDELPTIDPTEVDLSLDHMEVTQAIQTRNNELPLVRGKETLARVLVTHNLSDTLEVRVTFEAYGARRSGIANLGTRTVTFEAPPNPDRDDLDDSANLELPATWTDERALLLTAKIEPTSVSYEDTSSADDDTAESLALEKTYDPTVYIVRINEGPANNPEKPSWRKISAMRDEFEDTFPVGDPNFVYLGSGALGPQSGQEDINLLGELIKLKAAIAKGKRLSSFPTPDILVGATDDPRADGAIGLAAVAYPNGRSGTVASWADTPRAFVHEIVHNIGNNTWGRHVADASQGYGCGADGPDALWNRRFNDDSIHALGWEDGAGLKEATLSGQTLYHDFMTYCGPAWVSDYRWKMLLERFQNFTPGETIHPDLQSGSGGSSPSGASERSMRLISGRISREGSATLDPSFVLSGNATGENAGEFADPQAIAVIEYTDGETVRRQVRVNFNRSAHGEDSGPESLPFALRLPADENATVSSIRLIDPETGDTLASREAPGFSVESAEFSIPQQFERNATTTVELSLQTTAEGPLYKRVLYVPRGEGLEAPLSTRRYSVPMGMAFTGDRFNASFQGLPGAEAGRFVVLVSNGVRTEAVVSPVFEVPFKPPDVRISGSRSFNVTYDREAGSPGNRPIEGIQTTKDEIRTTAGAVISVDASGQDQFGRPLAGRETAQGEPTLQWELLDESGTVVATDTGPRFVGAPGAIGEYTLRVTATDPTTGLTATDTIPVIVEAPPLPEREELQSFRTAIATITENDTATGPRLELVPATRNVTVGGTVTYDLVFDPATNGVAAYDLNVSVANDSVAGIASATDAIGGRLSSIDVTAGGERVRFRVAGGSGGTGTVTLATVTLEAREPGRTRLSLSNVLVGDRNDTAYTIAGLGNATLQVEPKPEAPVVTDSGKPAKDLDGDGYHEDIDGTKSVNIIDAAKFLDVFDSEPVRNNVALFDFNRDSTINILDVVALLEEV